jgi:hypothetical protein
MTNIYVILVHGNIDVLWMMTVLFNNEDNLTMFLHVHLIMFLHFSVIKLNCWSGIKNEIVCTLSRKLWVLHILNFPPFCSLFWMPVVPDITDVMSRLNLLLLGLLLWRALEGFFSYSEAPSAPCYWFVVRFSIGFHIHLICSVFLSYCSFFLLL